MSLNLQFLAIIGIFMAYTVSSARDIPIAAEPENIMDHLGGADKAGEVVDCWNALSEIKSCSGEITAFFTNGTADIGPRCCLAITEITRSCWPALLTTLGFSTQQTNILRGYCDAESGTTFAVPIPSPSLQPITLLA